MNFYLFFRCGLCGLCREILNIFLFLKPACTRITNIIGVMVKGSAMLAQIKTVTLWYAVCSNYTNENRIPIAHTLILSSYYSVMQPTMLI